jgi:hypothetical protein
MSGPIVKASLANETHVDAPAEHTNDTVPEGLALDMLDITG